MNGRQCITFTFSALQTIHAQWVDVLGRVLPLEWAWAWPCVWRCKIQKFIIYFTVYVYESTHTHWIFRPYIVANVSRVLLNPYFVWNFYQIGMYLSSWSVESERDSLLISAAFTIEWILSMRFILLHTASANAWIFHMFDMVVLLLTSNKITSWNCVVCLRKGIGSSIHINRIFFYVRDECI